ncbi:MAG: chromate transporter, partial [Lachnospiraceae bacterium]|nr:chromate transporter [Lachnospiraceae bacterium]
MGQFATMVMSMLKVGCIGFGGGSALIPVLQKEAVQDKGLITEEELDSNIVAASITPGALPVEMASGIGKKVGGFWGMYAGAAAMAFPGSFFVMLFLIFTSLLGPKILSQVNFASIGITTYIILILAEYIITTLKKARNNRGGMIQAMIVILTVWMFNGEKSIFT